MPAGIIPSAIISPTQFPLSSIVGNPSRAAFIVSGFCKIFAVTSVIIHNKPSEPVINPNKSYPGESKTFPPIVVIVPSIKTIFSPKILLVVVPYFKE